MEIIKDGLDVDLDGLIIIDKNYRDSYLKYIEKSFSN